MRKQILSFVTVSACWIAAVLVLGNCAGPNNNTAPAVEEPASTAPAAPTHTTQTAAKQPLVKHVARPAPLVHTVTWHGETLSAIAKWYTGRSANWRLLANANPGLNPNRIHRGDRVVIPSDILKTRKPLPKNFLARSRPTSTKKAVTASPKSPPDPKKPLPLFGPKAYSGTYGQP